MGWGIYEIKKYLSELRFLSHGDGIIGYTNETLMAEYDQDDEGLYNILENRYNLTEEQIAALQPYSAEYNIPVKKGIGIQADWTLDKPDAFGYIYHKPRILWSWDEVEFVPPEEESETTVFPLKEDTDYYAKNSIEFIYDHYNDDELTNIDLFGPNRQTDSWLTARI